MNRREFIRDAAILAAGCAVGCRTFDGSSYSVPLLGDIHYDLLPVDTFHSHYRSLHQGDGLFARYGKEFESFASMWGRDGATEAIVRTSGRVRSVDSAFALQLGDLVEGDCESAADHVRMLNEAFAFVKGAYGGELPVVTTAGNHDVRQGKDRLGEYETYRRISSAWHAKELGVSVSGLTFSFRQGPDLWIVADFNRPDADRVAEILSGAEDARYVFFCTHGAVLTDGGRNARRWFFLGAPQYDERGVHRDPSFFGPAFAKMDGDRRRIRRLLARHRAIALTGHSHRVELRDWFGDGGRITEFVMNSVTRTVAGAPIPGELKVIGDRPEDFGHCRVKEKAKRDAAIDALYAEYEPGMRRYFTANGAGHARIGVSDGSVWIDYFPGAAESPSRRFVLRTETEK